MRLSWSSGEVMQERELMHFTACRPVRGVWLRGVWLRGVGHRGVCSDATGKEVPNIQQRTIRKRKRTLSSTFLDATAELRRLLRVSY